MGHMIENLIKKLQELQGQPLQKKALVGFDGYIDLIQKVVRSSEKESKQYFCGLGEMGNHIAAAAGKSAQLEICTVTKKAGGNGPIMANCLAHLGIQNHCIGTMGRPTIHESFSHIHSNCNLISVGEPGITNALEFEDGKLMLSELSTFHTLDWTYILDLQGAALIDQYLSESDLIAMVDWANLPLCTQLWKQMHQHIRRAGFSDKIYFFDLCDPSKKTPDEISTVLGVISAFRQLGTVILGLNENEAMKVHQVLEPANGPISDALGLDTITQNIFNAMDIDLLLIHPNDRTVIVTKDGVRTFKGHIVQAPKVLTGGGDNLNAGFCFGLLNLFSIEESAILGMATSGAYIQNGNSPTVADLITYLNHF